VPSNGLVKVIKLISDLLNITAGSLMVVPGIKSVGAYQSTSAVFNTVELCCHVLLEMQMRITQEPNKINSIQFSSHFYDHNCPCVMYIT
jgi:hypothetical protein